MNLVINAAEAMEGCAGCVTVVTRSHADAAGCAVVVEVRDTGCGMDEGTLARIFDPFFSTKFTGRGLGLAAVMGIIRTHRGTISVDSRPGQGSTFLVKLPALAENTGAAPEEPAGSIRGQGTILVVDDEEMVRNMARSTLERCGYQVEVAADGRTAVEAVAARPADYTLVLLDLTMPVMDGEETLRRIHRIRPNMAVVLSSGYSEDEAVRRFQDRGTCTFLQKPYTAASLAGKVKQAVVRAGYRSAG
jgi:CheY-like chemotaxis protein